MSISAKQCSECERVYPGYALSCKCGHEFETMPVAQRASEGSAILSLSMCMAVFAIIAFLVLVFFLVKEGHPIIAVIVGTIGIIQNCAWIIMAEEINRIIRERAEKASTSGS